MATEPIFVVLDVSAIERRRWAGFAVLSDNWALTKPDINSLIAITTAVGFSIGAPERFLIFRGQPSRTRSSAPYP